MSPKLLALFVCVLFVSLRNSLLVKGELDDSSIVENPRLPFVESHQLTDGSIIDCVKIEHQLTLQHPLFKDHVIQEPPVLSYFNDLSEVNDTSRPKQLYHKEVGSCPQGTIPVLRSIDGKVHKKDAKFHRIPQRDVEANTAPGHFYTVGSINQDCNGGGGRITLWNPQPTMAKGNAAFNQLWVAATYDGGVTLNTAEVGWAVDILQFKDTQPHLFIYWTADNYNVTGCFNLNCAGFVQTSPAYVFGGGFTGDYVGTSMLFGANKLTVSADMWLYIEGIPMGYWPNIRYSKGLLQDALPTAVEWGGEIVNGLQTPQNNVVMGNGLRGSTATGPTPCGVNSEPGNIASMHYLKPDHHGVLIPHDATKMTILETVPYQYDTKVFYNQRGGTCLAGGTWLFYGGPAM